MDHLWTISELDTAAVEWIEREASRTGKRVEEVVRRLIYRGLEVEAEQAEQQRHHDLDHLAGTWSSDDAAAFAHGIADLSQIDSTHIE